MSYAGGFPSLAIGGDLVMEALAYAPVVHSPSVGGVNIAPDLLAYQANVRSPTVQPSVLPASILNNFANVLTTRNGSEEFNVSAGNNRVLIVAEYSASQFIDPVTAVSYGGQPMTKVIGAATTVGRDMNSGLWILDEAGLAAAVGDEFVLIPNSLGVSFRLAAGSYANIDQSDPVIDEFASTDDDAGNPPTEALTTRDEGFVVAALFANRGLNDGGATEDSSYSNMTERVGEEVELAYLSVADAPTTGLRSRQGRRSSINRRRISWHWL